MLKRGFFLFSVLMLVAGPAWAQTQLVEGTAPSGSDGRGVAGAIKNSWNEVDYSCNAAVSDALQRDAAGGGIQGLAPVPNGAGPTPLGPSPWLIVTCIPTSCGGQQVWAFFEVTSGGGTTVQAHDIDYQVTATGSGLSHTIGFDGNTPQSIDGGAFTFNLAGGDVIRITSGQSQLGTGAVGPPRTPAMGLAGLVGGALLIGGATAWRLRRRERA